MRRHLALVDSMRSVVALLITLSHGMIVLSGHGFFPIVSEGRTGGVDFFFTLSGFLIFYVYQGQLGAGALNARGFLRKRFMRIYPLVWFFTALSIPVLLAFPGIGSPHDRELGVIIKSFLLIPQQESPVLGALWSLSHVVLFYLVFSTAIAHKRLGLVLMVAWAALLVMGIVTTQTVCAGFCDSSVALAFLMSAFNLDFLVGCLLAWLVRTQRGLPAWLGPALLTAGGVAYVFGWSAGMGLDRLGVFATYLAGASCLLLGCAVIDLHRSVKVPRLVTELSNASYAIIVINLPVIVAVTKLAVWLFPAQREHGWALLALAVVCAGVGGVLVSRWLEPQLRRQTEAALDAASSVMGRWCHRWRSRAANDVG